MYKIFDPTILIYYSSNRARTNKKVKGWADLAINYNDIYGHLISFFLKVHMWYKNFTF